MDTKEIRKMLQDIELEMFDIETCENVSENDIVLIKRSDNETENPLTGWECFGNIVANCSRYYLGNIHSQSPTEYLEENKTNIAFYIPMYAYIHSGTTVSHKPFQCRFDSGMVGFAFLTKERFKLLTGKTFRNTESNRKKAKQICESTIEILDQYLNNEVFDYLKVEKIGENWEITETLYGNWGRDTNLHLQEAKKYFYSNTIFYKQMDWINELAS